MRKENPIWVVVIVLIAVVVIVVAIFWRAAKPLPEITLTPEQERLMEEAKERAFKEGGPAGGKIVPSPYAPKGR